MPVVETGQDNTADQGAIDEQARIDAARAELYDEATGGQQPEQEEEGEDPIAAAVRGVWEETGMRVDPGELKFLKEVNGSRIYELHVSFRRALDCWVVHQAERLTLTDWGRCPHSGVLDLLGIPRIVKSAYCETHGGPIFVKDVKDHTVEGVTLEILSS